MQKVLTMTTNEGHLRSAAEGWSAEDADPVRPGHIGNTPGFPGPYSYETPLHALGDGWRLLAPPQSFWLTINNGDPDETTVERWWWFVRN
jgi:hypothetical protein